MNETIKAGLDRYDPQYCVAKVTGFVKLPQGDEQSLLNAVAMIGPISVGIDASQK
jgi:cathepsin L